MKVNTYTAFYLAQMILVVLSTIRLTESQNSSTLERDDDATTTSTIKVTWTTPENPVELSIKLSGSDETIMLKTVGADSNPMTEFGSLQAGTSYSICLVTVVNSRNSTNCVDIGTRPNPPLSIKHSSNSPTNDTMTLTIKPPTVGRYDIISAWIPERPGNVSDETVAVFRNLIPCTQYTIKAVTEFSGLRSSEITKSFATQPSPPFNFMNTSASPTSITVHWMEPIQTCKTYLLTYGIKDGSYTNTTEVTGSSYVINGLQPASLYRVVIKTEGLGLESHIRNRDIATYPSTPSGLSPTMNDVGNVQVQWTSPDQGVIFDYEFKHENETIDSSSEVNTTACSTELDSDKVNTTACSTKLVVPGANYTFCVNAVAHGYRSGEKCLDFTLKPMPVQQLIARAINSSVATLTWNTDGESTQQSFDISFMGASMCTTPEYDTDVSASPYLRHELLPGENYTFLVNANSYGVKSEERSASCVMHPLAPVLECNNGTDNIELIITKEYGLVDKYSINCSEPSCPGLVNVSSSDDNVTEKFTGLTPLMNYTFEVIAMRLGEESLPAVIVCITQEGATTIANGTGVSVTVTTPKLSITLSSPLIAAIIVPTVLAVLAIVTNIVCVIYHRRRNQRKDQQQTHTDDFDEELSETVGVYEPIDDTTEPENMTS